MSAFVVVGGGPAGMMAALRAAERGWQVSLLERNEKLGKKLYITGKGRCNLTNTADTEEFFRHILRNPRFLMSGWQRFDNRALMAAIEQMGVPLKEERGRRVFPVSEKASDVTRALERALRARGVTVVLHCRVKEIITENTPQGTRVTGVMDQEGHIYPAQHVVVATGGLSYPATGSTGDGFVMAQAMGLEVTGCAPSLVSLVSGAEWISELAGLSLKNVALHASGFSPKVRKPWRSVVGEMMFTHKGVSGPLVLTLSAMADTWPFTLHIDLKPGLDMSELDARLLRDVGENSRKQLRNALAGLLPAALLPVVLTQAGLSPEQFAHQLDKPARSRLGEALKGLSVPVTGSGGYEEAVVTRGGVTVKQLNPRTMEAKTIAGLAFAGEMLDVDGTTGGFNLTIAFVTGYCAGDV